MNCGLLALSKIRDLKGISAFTLIHLARDNGVELKIFKVNLKDLPLVHRPAIFHAENHFEFIKNGEPLPDHRWTGFVLTEKSKGKPISLKEAKEIRGEGPVIPIAIAAVTAAAKAALVGAAVGAATAGITGGDVGRGALRGAKFGAMTGGLAGGIGGIAGSAAATGTSLAAKGAGLLQKGAQFATSGGAVPLYAGTGAVIGATTGETRGVKGALAGGLKGAGIGAGVAGVDKFGAAFGAAREGGATVGSSLASGFKSVAGFPSAKAGVPDQTLAGVSGTPTGYTGSITYPGVGSNLTLAQGQNLATGAGLVGAPGSRFSLANVSGAGEDSLLSKFLPSSKTAGLAGAGVLAAAGGKLGPQAPTTIDFDPAKEYSTIRTYLGDQALPQATERELSHFVDTPLDELTSELSFQSDKIYRRINESFDKQSANLNRQFAQSGQNVRNSSELREEMRKLELDRATALGEAEQEYANSNLSRGIQAKQFALSAALEKNVYEDRLALELADLIGQKAALETAIQQNNYESFQDIMGSILQIGYGSA